MMIKYEGETSFQTDMHMCLKKLKKIKTWQYDDNRTLDAGIRMTLFDFTHIWRSG